MVVNAIAPLQYFRKLWSDEGIGLFKLFFLGCLETSGDSRARHVVHRLQDKISRGAIDPMRCARSRDVFGRGRDSVGEPHDGTRGKPHGNLALESIVG